MSETKFEKPPVPFLTTVQTGLGIGRKIKIKGYSDYRVEQRFCINLGVAPAFRENVALHISPRHRPDDKCIVIAQSNGGVWGVQQRFKKTVHNKTYFEFKIVVENDCYKIEFNHRHLASVPFTFPPHLVNHLEIEGGVTISHVHVEGYPRSASVISAPPVNVAVPAYSQPPYVIAGAPAVPPTLMTAPMVNGALYNVPMGRPVTYMSYDYDCHHHHHHHC